MRRTIRFLTDVNTSAYDPEKLFSKGELFTTEVFEVEKDLVIVATTILSPQFKGVILRKDLIEYR